MLNIVEYHPDAYATGINDTHETKSQQNDTQQEQQNTPADHPITLTPVSLKPRPRKYNYDCNDDHKN